MITSNTKYFRGALLASLLFLIIIITMALPSQPAEAAGQIAMSGTFYSQDFEIPQGVEVANQSIYVVVFNQGNGEVVIHLTPGTPKDVELSFSNQDFSLKPGAQEKVYVGVKVSQDAVPGEYKLVVSAGEKLADTSGVIQMVTAVAQEAKLKITGESAKLFVNVVSPDGDPVVSNVRAFKEINGGLKEFVEGETGNLEAKLSLGHYIVRAYVGGEELAEEAVDMAIANEMKEITLTVKTAYFANFGIVPNYFKENGKLAFAKIVYQVRNLYQPMKQVDLILDVSSDYDTNNTPIESTFLSLSELPIGDTAGSREYIPPEGWQSGTYVFKAKMIVNGEPYANTLEEKLEVSVDSPSKTNHNVLYVVISVAFIVIAGIVFFILMNKRRVVNSGRK